MDAESQREETEVLTTGYNTGNLNKTGIKHLQNILNKKFDEDLLKHQGMEVTVNITDDQIAEKKRRIQRL